MKFFIYVAGVMLMCGYFLAQDPPETNAECWFIAGSIFGWPVLLPMFIGYAIGKIVL